MARVKYLLVVYLGLLSDFCFSQTIPMSADTLKTQELSEFVITGTKTFRRKTDSPVIVNVLEGKALQNLQACNVSEGLKFQPGLRIETNCQTCNYTQLRMNGLQGAYSQILINGRPIMSPLLGLYGMEQLPSNMVERIEVVRGGGSSLYGSSAIGGTVNIITRLPEKNEYAVNANYHSIDGQTADWNLAGNAALLSKSKRSGLTVFANRRLRGMYDASNDRYSEIPELNQTSFGINAFKSISENQKLEVFISHLNEYRYGGEMVDKPVYLAQQAEERMHQVWMGSADYQLNFNQNRSSFIVYAAGQLTTRTHYTGLFPDNIEQQSSHLQLPPFGSSDAKTLHAGFQVNHELKLLNKRNVLTVGSEFIGDQVLDEIPAYAYRIDQYTSDWGSFVQSDWDFAPQFTLLSGLRIDRHNLLQQLQLSPRLALMYKLKNATQFRLSYGSGFRAPQAFDTDMHVAFAAGGISRIQLAQGLMAEQSNSLGASVNYDRVKENWIAGFTLEYFYTRLENAFVLENIGADTIGELFEKRNGDGAFVKGATLELRANWNKKMQIEAGFTLQQNLFDNPISYIQNTLATRNFLRTPNDYGYANLNLHPWAHWDINLSYVYTGRMQLAHFGGAQNFPNDELVWVKAFSELNLRLAYIIPAKMRMPAFELYIGIKNILNSYQSDFDIGKFRDSNYIYGPALPRSVYVGFRLKSID
jgi:outer membrane receptor for ferrienterochelin and colicins